MSHIYGVTWSSCQGIVLQSHRKRSSVQNKRHQGVCTSRERPRRPRGDEGLGYSRS